ncbi:SAM-dependent methyltransferase [Planotetraspora sp. GP83]|uniref:SAM-dependent methyltransferase n=1 Tax=Planotetraspora sp. GP83 TaxID=3156264 RepID=UPI003513CA71
MIGFPPRDHDGPEELQPVTLNPARATTGDISGLDGSQRVSVAGLYDVFLGGTHNSAADRAAADQVLKISPEARDSALANRQFLIEAVRHLAADRGIRQFLDLGSGLPTQENVHQVAQAVDEDARVVYVDNDPEVLPEAAGLLIDEEFVGYIDADMRVPESILNHETTQRLIDFSEPVAVLMVAVLHFVGDDYDPQGLVRRYMEDVPTGSYLVVSHASTDEIDPAVWERIQATNPRLTRPLTFRPGNEIERFFDGLDLLPPGMVDVPQWRPGVAVPAARGPLRIWSGVAVKP